MQDRRRGGLAGRRREERREGGGDRDVGEKEDGKHSEGRRWTGAFEEPIAGGPEGSGALAYTEERCALREKPGWRSPQGTEAEHSLVGGGEACRENGRARAGV